MALVDQVCLGNFSLGESCFGDFLGHGACSTEAGIFRFFSGGSFSLFWLDQAGFNWSFLRILSFSSFPFCGTGFDCV